MKTITLYKFIQDNNIEYHWHDKNVIIFVNIYLIEEFTKMLPSGLFDDNGIECRLKDGYFAIWMEGICNYCNIEMADIFESER